MGKVLIGNVRGPKGDQGERGPQGLQGPQGPQGESGEISGESLIEYIESTAENPPTSPNKIKDILGWLIGKTKGIIAQNKNLTQSLDDKAPKAHKHTAADISDIDQASVKYAASAGAVPWGKVSSKPSTFPPAAHNQDWDTITGKPSTFSPASHNHDDRYYTESEVNTKLGGKLNTSGGTVTGRLTLDQHLTIETNQRVMWKSGACLLSGASQHLYIGGSDEGQFWMHLGVHDNMWTLDPDDSGKLTLGTANHRWGQVYSTSSTISTSDKNQKHDINPISDQYMEFFLRLLPVSYKYNDGTSGRTHIGYISQDVEAAMAEVGLTDLDFAGFCRDQKTVQVPRTIMVKAVNENGEEYEEAITYLEDVPVEGEYVYSLRYEEFIALNTAVIQSLLRRVHALEDQVSKLSASTCSK